MIKYGRADSEADLKQILALQRENLPANISSQEKKKEGFITVSHTLHLLKEMNDACAHIVAKYDDAVIGYALCMHPRFAEKIEVLRPMFEKIENLNPKIEKYIAMGQICIAKKFRGQGVFHRLYQTLQQTVQPEFKQIVTEVDAENMRSLRAHYALGFQDLLAYYSGNQNWKVIVLP